MKKVLADFQHNLTTQIIPAQLNDWLFYPGSFIERLQNQQITPTVQVLKQDWQNPDPDEKNDLALETDDSMLIREVLISSGDIHWMFARTVFPRSTLTGEQQELAHLENRSLGSVLFKDPTLQRSPFKVALLQPGMALYDRIAQQLLSMSSPFHGKDIYARRSVFHVQNKPLLLTEVFLPAIEDVPFA